MFYFVDKLETLIFVSVNSIIMKKIAIISLSSLLVFSCQSTEVNVEERVSNPVSMETEDVAVLPTKVATIEITGMTCVKGCGGSIRKSLKGTKGVERVSFDFDADRATDIATVYFDDQIVSVDEMKQRLSVLNNNQFTVGEISIKDFSATSSNNSESKSTSEDSKIDACNSTFEFPNLLDIFSSFLTIG